MRRATHRIEAGPFALLRACFTLNPESGDGSADAAAILYEKFFNLTNFWQ
jgi:hypothetical protein